MVDSADPTRRIPDLGMLLGRVDELTSVVATITVHLEEVDQRTSEHETIVQGQNALAAQIAEVKEIATRVQLSTDAEAKIAVMMGLVQQLVVRDKEQETRDKDQSEQTAYVRGLMKEARRRHKLEHAKEVRQAARDAGIKKAFDSLQNIILALAGILVANLLGRLGALPAPLFSLVSIGGLVGIAILLVWRALSGNTALGSAVNGERRNLPGRPPDTDDDDSDDEDEGAAI